MKKIIKNLIPVIVALLFLGYFGTEQISQVFKEKPSESAVQYIDRVSTTLDPEYEYDVRYIYLTKKKVDEKWDKHYRHVFWSNFVPHIAAMVVFTVWYSLLIRKGEDEK